MVVDRIPTGITRNDILHALADLNAGIEHRFAESIKYDVVHEGKRYPPKAVVGLAARRILGEALGPSDFSGGRGSKCFRVLEGLGFVVEAKREAIHRPTANIVELEHRTRELRRERKREKPNGSQSPKKIVSNSTQYERDPAVRAWVLDNADGVCELCNHLGPFQTNEGDPFLEVHHVVPIAEGGPDTIDNAVALCPNCHRRCHLSIDCDDQKIRLYKQVERLRE